MTVKCRVWWPKELSSSSSNSPLTTSSSSRSLLLFGWFISCSSSCLDIVVAFAFSDHFLSLHSSDFAIQEAVHLANERLPVILQEKRSLTVLGHCVLPYENVDLVDCVNLVDIDHSMRSSEHIGSYTRNGEHTLDDPRSLSCGCLKSNGLLEKYRHASMCSSVWIQLVYDACSYSSIGICGIPSLDHIHWNGEILSQAELHVMVYETPRFGSHHFILKICNSKLTKCMPRRPKWVDELYHKHQLTDLDTVILSINCSGSANVNFCNYLGLRCSSSESVSYMFLSFLWRFWAIAIATFSTLLYIVLQLLNKLARWGSKYWMCTALAKLFNNTWKNTQVRCHQILYWPIFLGKTDRRSQACVEYAEKAGLQRHSLWTSAAMDVILGNLVGLPLLFHAEAVLKWFSNVAVHLTDDVLRTGCVWLMGVPAGFKLNTELAGVFGIISLNAIQIWCTLWFSAADIFCYVIKIVALSGILLGLTVPMALISDIIAIAAVLVYTLHYSISLLYSLQIQTLTALWRLFRGRKWNPLRRRLDSYEYSVEQHVVGSLLFTPVLLLLPTTSVFYIFFSIMNLTILFSLTLIEMLISVVHDTPYSKILIWLTRPKRLPSGIWFEIIECHSASLVDGFRTGSSIPCKSKQQDNKLDRRKSVTLLSLLCSNNFTLGQVVFPHYKSIFDGVNGQTLRFAISGILTGKSLLSAKSSEVLSKTPWMSIPFQDYWYICYNAVLAHAERPC